MIGANLLLTTEYHLATNGMVGRLHWQLKAGIKYHKNNSYSVKVPRRKVSHLKPIPETRFGARKTFVFKELSCSPFVFIRHEAVGDLFQPNYDGLFEVKERNDTIYTVIIKGKQVTVSNDRLKRAFIREENTKNKNAADEEAVNDDNLEERQRQQPGMQP
ncbi:uncharacterized protein LOC117183027 [Belonocnema kinseyi]|uniref:uncharacterized protein LOC117183027 n=1 Tax=Belonocnema kinseyi TaxID=2817044 RepID=UPI00143CDA9C|nr:uncharacterized protein LOC117183027 [Belonocnema kinseyi]